jgi:hypothetical protein
LIIDTISSNLSDSNSKIRTVGHFDSSDNSNKDLNNGTILTLSNIIKYRTTSTPKAEVAAPFYNCKAAFPLRVTLKEICYPQPPTPVITDNITAKGFSNKTMVPNKARSYDMRFNFLSKVPKGNLTLS